VHFSLPFKTFFMEEKTLQQKTPSTAEKNLLAFFETHDIKYVAEDAVFKSMNTGESYKGRTEIGGMLHHIYHVAFNAKSDLVNYVMTGDKAVVEGMFKGKHTGDFAGVRPTNKEVSVPFAVSYDFKDSLIQGARIYMMGDLLLRQLGVNASPSQKTTFVVRDIFQLKFGHFRDAKKLMEEANEKHMLPEAQQVRVLSDFTGDSYRLIFEEGYESLTDYETSLTSSMHTDEWQHWYEKFKPHVDRSYREILKQVF
jgi:predicted ester cyclase